MAGTVGCAVAGSPGYSGYVPSSEQPLTCSNSMVTQRLHVSQRRTAAQPQKGMGSPLKADSSGKVPEAQQPVDPSTFFLAKRVDNPTVYSSDAGRAAVRDAAFEYPRTKMALLKQSHDNVKKGPLPTPFTATTLAEANCSGLDKAVDKSFFSRAQKVEQEDEDVRKAEGVNSKSVNRTTGRDNLASEKKLQKRLQGEGDFAPPKRAFENQERRALLGAEPVSASEFVKFKGAMCDMTSSQREFGCRGSNPQERMGANARDMESKASTMDLFAGTAKSALGLRIPGYVGHVPAHGANAGKMRADADLTKKNAKNLILLSTGSRTLPGYSGFEPKSVYNDTGKANAPPKEATSAGDAANIAAVGKERELNVNEFGKTQGVRKFFSQGGGAADNTISDQYYLRYRPNEGLLKMGAPAERTIPTVR